ncbi:nucleotidyl transferase AbiEii/AbiGii toxin family protein [Nonomuraea sp. NPDC050394]|uniref:nucleotidyl transferase AbiEii/AbiGii toxin family protein n=1 Tax=Nonomuraea sp. NPDC050394 TaxID=3364363 RepID=UPI00379B3C5D
MRNRFAECKKSVVTHPAETASWGGRDYAALPLISRLSLRSYASAIEGLAHVLPHGLWHVKGATALLAHVGPTARLPRDLDVSVAEPAAEALLRRTSPLEDDEGGLVDILGSETMRFSDARAKPQVYRVLLGVGRDPLITLITADVLVIPEVDALADKRATSIRFPTSRTWVPAATLSRCLAQKLLRYTLRRSGNRLNTRWSDLWDFLVAVSSPAATELDASVLRDDIEIEFSHMGRTVPATLSEPPAEWLDHWDAHSFQSRLSFGSLNAAAARLALFWDPLLSYGGVPLRWNPASWEWRGSPTTSVNLR